MSEVQSVYDAIKNGSGQARQIDLYNLSQKLTVSTTIPTEALLLDLQRSPNDARRVILDAIHARSDSAFFAKKFMAPILEVVRQTFCAPSTSLSAIRTASSALKALSSLFKPNDADIVCPLTPLEMQSLIETVLAAMAWGLALPLDKRSIVTTPKTQRKPGPGSAFAFDRREESQVSTWKRSYMPSSTPVVLAKKSSAASLSSLHSEASTSVASTAAGFETDHSFASDGDEGNDFERRQKRLREARRGVRYRSIVCLSSLIEHYSKLLLIHWPRILLDAAEGGASRAASLMDVAEKDDSVSNRIAAVHAVQTTITLGSKAGFMAGAEEGSRLSAFTSLSSRIASIIVDLRRRLVVILINTSTPPSLLEATIKCTRAIVVSTPKVKLRVAHSEVLREVTLKLCSQSDSASAVSAFSLLSALVAGEKKGGRDAIAGDNILATLQDQTLPLQVRVEAWNTMTALAEKGAVSDMSAITLSSLIHSAISVESPLEVRQAAASFAQACLSKECLLVDDLVLEQLAKDSSPIIRSITANCLASVSGKEALLELLLVDNDNTVRASAVRAIGVKIQSEGKCVLDQQVFRLLCDDSLLVRMRASWTLGNLCEVRDDYMNLLQKCYGLKDDDERVIVNAIRGIGAVLARCSLTEEIQQSSVLLESILTWLCTALLKGGPKIRWNVSACLARSLTISSMSHLLASLHQHQLANTLAEVIVEDNTFKVRLSAVQALLNLTEQKELGTLEVIMTVRRAVHEAVTKIEDQVKQASFKEAQLHAIPLQQLLVKLSELLQLRYPP